MILKCDSFSFHSLLGLYSLVLVSSYLALLAAAERLYCSFTPAQSVDIRNYILNYLAQHVEHMHQLVRANLVQTVARITKLGWFAAQEHREVCNSISKFLLVPCYIYIYMYIYCVIWLRYSPNSLRRTISCLHVQTYYACDHRIWLRLFCFNSFGLFVL